MTAERLPEPPTPDPGQPVAQVLDVFAHWLAEEATPAIAARTRRLRQVAPALRGTGEVDVVVAHLELLLPRLDALAVVLRDRVPGADEAALEALVDAVADRCGETRALMTRARVLLARAGVAVAADGGDTDGPG